MLNSPLPRSSHDSPSPGWHYAELSPPRSSLSRRSPNSKSKSPRTRTRLQVTNYVDVGTQWSPRMDSHVQRERLNVADAVVKAEEVEPATVDLSVEVSTSTPILKPELPTMKRHPSREIVEDRSSSVTSSNGIAPKRARSATEPVKFLPARYELCEVEDIVILIANMISELIATNDALPLRTGVLTRFHSRIPPGISVLDYLQRLAKHATLTPPLLLSMVYYIDRLCALYPAFTITTLTVHRFLITAATVAAKGLSDSFWNNATYARVGGVKIAELGMLELEFLHRVDWRIVPNPEVLVDYYHGLIDRCQGYELESDSKSQNEDEDEGEDEEDDEVEDGSPDVKSEAATDMQWKAWMDDVSTQRSRNEEANHHR